MKRVIILENIRSLHNVGAIFRTGDGAGWDKVCICGYTGCPPDRRIEKVSLGAEEFLAWEHFESAQECVQSLKEEGFEIVALEQSERSTDLFEYKKSAEKIALIFGNEVDGVSSELLDIAEKHLEIPMHGQKASLNVSVAAGIALYALN